MSPAFREASPPPSPSYEPHHHDPQLYKHLPLLVDGVTKEPVTAQTTLATLYDFTDLSVDHALLKNLAGISVSVPCQVKVADELFPPTDDHGCRMSLMYNKLLLAPAVRLQCDFFDEERPDSEPYLSLAVEWHFNDHDGSESGILRYSHRNNGVISFTAGSATCSGFNNILQHREKLEATESQVVLMILKSFLKRGVRRTLSFQVHEYFLTPENQVEFNKIRYRLPGGTGPLLPTIGKVEYAAFGDDELTVHSRKDGMRRPMDLMSGDIKHPMVPLTCSDTFTTIKEAGVQLAYSATIADAEAREALRMWAAMAHKSRLFAYGNLAALGVQFGKFDKLGSMRDQLHYRLPRELQSSMRFQIPRRNKEVVVEGFLLSNTSGLPSYDAIFLLTSQSLEVLAKYTEDFTAAGKQSFGVHFSPYYNSRTYASQLETVARLQRQDSRRWHEILLNQAYDLIPNVDLTTDARIPAKVRADADAWLLQWMDWNTEQLQVIAGIKRAKGGAVVVMGPAGTGKTLLQQALAIYFWKIGYHVLALAPANSNADHLARQLDMVRARDEELHNLKFCRLYPGSRDSGLSLLEERQAVQERVGSEEKKSVLSFHELLVALEELKNTGWFSRPYGVVEIVARMALLRRFELKQPLRDERSHAYGPPVNSWEILREFISAYQTGTLDLHKDRKEVMKYRRAYQACKGHIISMSRFLITTTGNVRAPELLEYWTSHEFGGHSLGVMVFVDEAAKDVEANVWGGIVCEAWAELVKGVFFFGDDRQLKPTNTSSKDRVQFNAYNNRLDLSLPVRLVREGFPCFRLLEQRRMHWAIAKFANDNFYDGKLRNGPGADNLLDDVKPGFKRVLEEILGGVERDEQDIRLAWIQVNGERRRTNMSMLVQEHVDVFFKYIFPKLLQYFSQFTDKKDKMESNVMIICAYSATLYAYRDRIHHMLARDSTLTQADMPRVLTVDASQGDESFMVFFDGAFQHGDMIGFMDDPGRANVAVTRAKEVFWIVGGAMQYRFRDSVLEPMNHMTKYKREIDTDGRSHHFRL